MKLLTCKEVAELIRAKPSTVYAWAEQGFVPCFKINGLLRFDEADVIRWLQDHKKPGLCYNGKIQAREPGKGGKF
jgi:excisionase family DNA binding protein